MTTMRVRRYSDIMPPTPEEAKRSEKSFRRGYSKGFWEAMDSFSKLHQAGYVRIPEVHSMAWLFWITRLWQWAFQESCRTVVCAPRLHHEWESWWEVRRKAFTTYGRVCDECGSMKDLQIDHITEVKNGGLPDLDNLRVLCKKCNMKRNRSANKDMPVHECTLESGG